MDRAPVIDALQYTALSEDVFREMRAGGVDAVHVTVAYHETFRELASAIGRWNRAFRAHGELIFQGRSATDIARAQAEGRTAIFFGAQTPAIIEDDIDLVEVCHALGLRFMQLSYNNQSLLCAGCYEAEDAGITRMGAEVIAEMNRLGMVIDMSHSAERSTLDTIERSARPIAVTHANPARWHDVPRNKSDRVIAALAETGGMLGFSLYPHHLANGSETTLAEFAAMVADTAERHGAAMLGIGSDLCQGRPDSAVRWMRSGRWTRDESDAVFPPQPSWFRSNLDFPRIAEGLSAVGFSADDVAGLLGGNWARFLGEAWEARP